MQNSTFETQLRRLLRKTSGLDLIVLRLSVIFIFALFGTYKWFTFEANALHHLLPGTWLGALYPTFGVQGLSYALGVVEYITLLALIIGFFRPDVGAAGALMVTGTGIVTLSLLPQLGRIDSFIIKDVLLIGGGLVLLRHDLRRALINLRGARAQQLIFAHKPRQRTNPDHLTHCQPWGGPELRSSLLFLARKYDTTPGFIERGMEAAFRAGVTPRYFLERYLENKPLPVNPDFEKHYLDLINEQAPSPCE